MAEQTQEDRNRKEEVCEWKESEWHMPFRSLTFEQFENETEITAQFLLSRKEPLTFLLTNTPNNLAFVERGKRDHRTHKPLVVQINTKGKEDFVCFVQIIEKGETINIYKGNKSKEGDILTFSEWKRETSNQDTDDTFDPSNLIYQQAENMFINIIRL